MRVIGHSRDNERWIVAMSDDPARQDRDALIVDVERGSASPVMPLGSILAMGEADDWIMGSGNPPGEVMTLARKHPSR